jgi:hypothetical protein
LSIARSPKASGNDAPVASANMLPSSARVDKKKANLIDAIVALVREKIPKPAASQVESFVRHYYARVAPEDLVEGDVADLYGAAIAHWNLFRKRAPGTHTTRIYNPNLQEHGWRSIHTIRALLLAVPVQLAVEARVKPLSTGERVTVRTAVERVVARAAINSIIAFVSADQVIAPLTDDIIVTVQADDDIVAGGSKEPIVTCGAHDGGRHTPGRWVLAQ